MSFIEFCNGLSPLDKTSADALLDKLQTKTFQKGSYLLKVGSVCRYLYFADTGLVKLFFHKEGKEFIMRFFPDKSLFSVLDSFIPQTPSNFNIVALETTTVTYIDHAALEEICKKHHSVETLYRKITSLASINMMKRISEMLEENTTTHYHNFVKENNQLFQRISLGDMASYLGISQVTLSRIRAKK